VHYLTYVIVGKNTNIKQAVAKALAPFDEARTVKPWKRCLAPDEIAAMAKCFGLRPDDLDALAAKMPDWNGGTGRVDGKRLFALLTYNRDGKWDWFQIGGRWAGLLPNDSMTCRALHRSRKLQDLLPHDFVTPDGKWHAGARFIRTGWCTGLIVHRSKGNWLQQFRAALASYPDHRVVCVDRHS
jgi:hypothetical protein